MPPAFLLSSGLPGAVPLDLSQGSSQGSCQCWQQHGEDTAVFYNRVPKCGSTTMLRCASTLSAPSEPSAPLCSPLRPTSPRLAPPRPASPRLAPPRPASPHLAPRTPRSYIDNASKRLGFPNGSTGPERNAFNFYQATQPEDFDNSRWAPGPSRAHEILSGMLAEAPGAELPLPPLPPTPISYSYPYPYSDSDSYSYSFSCLPTPTPAPAFRPAFLTSGATSYRPPHAARAAHALPRP